MSEIDSTKKSRGIEVHAVEYEPEFNRSKVLQAHLLDGKTELEPIVDQDLDAFAKFYVEALGNGVLSRFERAVIKTYIHWKTHPQAK